MRIYDGIALEDNRYKPLYNFAPLSRYFVIVALLHKKKLAASEQLLKHL